VNAKEKESKAAANLEKLPESCATKLLTDEQPIIIKKGESGYYPAPSELDVESYNLSRNITKGQVKAMESGSMFGWHVPAADPDMYTVDGWPSANHER